MEGVVTKVFHAPKKNYVVIKGTVKRSHIFSLRTEMKCFLPVSMTDFAVGKYAKLAGHLDFGKIICFMTEEAL